jgi:hypothetical protein
MLAPLTLVAAAATVVAFAVFAFPSAGAAMADQTPFNRITLQFAPLAVVFAVLSFHAFAVRWSAAAADVRAD